MSRVYFLGFDNLDRITEVMDKAGIRKVVKENDYTAVKIHFGERGNTGYVRPEMVRPILNRLKELGGRPFLTDTATIYTGERDNAISHLRVAEEHGFTLANCGVPVIIADGLRGNSYKEVCIDKKHFKKVKIGEALYNADTIVLVTHFKGHEMSGFGGVLKNAGMGSGARPAKYEMHSSVLPNINQEKCTGCEVCLKWCAQGAIKMSEVQSLPDTNRGQAPSKVKKQAKIDEKRCVGCGECVLACVQKSIELTWNESVKNVQEKMVEYVYGSLHNKKGKVFCINFINNVTSFCDCYGKSGEKVVPDLGVLFSLDPVAIDQASIDLVNQSGGKDVFRQFYPQVDWNIQLQYAEELGLGERKYKLVKI